MARNEHDAMIAHTLHLKQKAMLLDIQDRITNNTDISPEFRAAVLRQVDEIAQAVAQADQKLMQEGGNIVRLSGTNIVLGSD